MDQRPSSSVEQGSTLGPRDQVPHTRNPEMGSPNVPQSPHDGQNQGARLGEIKMPTPSPALKGSSHPGLMSTTAQLVKVGHLALLSLIVTTLTNTTGLLF